MVLRSDCQISCYTCSPSPLQPSESKLLCVPRKLSILGYVTAGWFSSKSQKSREKAALKFYTSSLMGSSKIRVSFTACHFSAKVMKCTWTGILKAFFAAVIVGTWIVRHPNAKQPTRNFEIIFDMHGLLLHERL